MSGTKEESFGYPPWIIILATVIVMLVLYIAVGIV
jgi:hypothetical protein